MNVEAQGAQGSQYHITRKQCLNLWWKAAKGAAGVAGGVAVASAANKLLGPEVGTPAVLAQGSADDCVTDRDKKPWCNMAGSGNPRPTIDYKQPEEDESGTSSGAFAMAAFVASVLVLGIFGMRIAGDIGPPKKRG